MEDNIYDYITEQENGYQKPIDIEDGWSWSMKEHLRLSFLYKHSQFAEKNEDRDLRPNKNIIRPILNVQYRTEGFDVKDIELYINNKDFFYKSLLVRKYHEKWALENGIDTFIDEMVESYVDYGGALVKNVEGVRPDVVDLRTLAFCDQRDILSNPFAIKHRFTPSGLREQKKWGQGEGTMDIETLITLTKDEEYIEVYELHGVLPGDWLGSEDKDVPQIQIVAYYKDQNKQAVGVTLFKNREPKPNFKFLSRDKVSDRALGFGGIEELFESQVWTNFDEIKITEMLDSASKTLFKSNDPAFKTRNNLSNVDNLEVLKLGETGDISQLDTYPRNLPIFNESVTKWQEHAQTMGSASEALLGDTPNSGTPFKLYEAQQMENKGMHKYRQGKIAVFTDEIYRDWVLPYISKEIVNDQEFLTELSSDEMQSIAGKIRKQAKFGAEKEAILAGQPINPEEIESLVQKTDENIREVGTQWFVKIIKGEFKDAPIGIRTNIAGKQKNLALLTDKVVNVLRQYISTPQIRQDPEMTKLLNVILESSGMSPIMFGASPTQQPQQGGGGTEALQDLANTQNAQPTT